MQWYTRGFQMVFTENVMHLFKHFSRLNIYIWVFLIMQRDSLRVGMSKRWEWLLPVWGIWRYLPYGVQREWREKDRGVGRTYELSRQLQPALSTHWCQSSIAHRGWREPGNITLQRNRIVRSFFKIKITDQRVGPAWQTVWSKSRERFPGTALIDLAGPGTGVIRLVKHNLPFTSIYSLACIFL